MVKVGIIGLGGMGNKHLGCYEEVHEAQVVAIADVVEEKLQPGQSTEEINIGAGGGLVDPDRHRLYAGADELIDDDEVEMVDVCLPTFLHAEYCIKALEAGKHVLCEKPMALSYEQCEHVLETAQQAAGKFMVAQVVRFFPAYEYLNETVESGRLGRLTQLSMWRTSAPPQWSWQGWLLDADRSGGGILDLHVHDADFVQYLLGQPKAVCATGATGPSGGYDVVDAQYIYGDMAVAASGNLAMPRAWEFDAGFMAVFEDGSLLHSTGAPHGLMEITHEGSHHPQLGEKDGYQEEIAYFVQCVQNDELPAIVTPRSSALSVRMVEAERESIEAGGAVEL